MKFYSQLILAFLTISFLQAIAHAAPEDYFAIEVIDEATGRGIPLVQLQTTDHCVYYTDSNGLVAFNEPGLMGESVWFSISSHGYEFPHESFGTRGTALKAIAGTKTQLKMRRINIAERLYRMTGRGIYRDTILLRMKPPIEFGALNGRVMGQDSVLTTICNGKLFWFWGDTNRPSHVLGNYATTGATSLLPGSGGLDPSVGVNLTYFTEPKSGLTAHMVPLKRAENVPIWIDAVTTVLDETKTETILARFSRVDKAMKPIESGLLKFSMEQNHFVELKPIAPNAPLAPTGHPFKVSVDGVEYLYFLDPYPCIRTQNNWSSMTDLSTYEGFTCLKEGRAYTKTNPALDRDGDGKLVWKWRKDSHVLKPAQIEELISTLAVKRDEVPFRLRNVDDQKPIHLHNATVYWNDYRKTWVMIALQSAGTSYLGEIWFAEAHSPEGPWIDAKKVATHAKQHDNQDFYNPVQHPYFAQQDGKIIYFEGTYTNTFSGNPYPTPNYEYNQIMYRLDLSDPRLKLPLPAPGLSTAQPVK
jgi:hypothetical protein